MSTGRRESFDRETLLAYAAGELSAQDTGAIEAYLARDDAARDLVALYRSVRSTVIGDDSVAPPIEAIHAAKAIFDPGAIRRRLQAGPTWADSLRQLIASLVFDSRVQPALAGYRGGSSGFELGFTSEAADIDLQAEPALDDDDARLQVPARWRIIGQVSPNEASLEAAMPPVAVALVRREQADVQATETIDADEHGVFTIQADPGRYDLHVRIGDTVVILQDVRIA